jgi:hypothetical protein
VNGLRAYIKHLERWRFLNDDALPAFGDPFLRPASSLTRQRQSLERDDCLINLFFSGAQLYYYFLEIH